MYFAYNDLPICVTAFFGCSHGVLSYSGETIRRPAKSWLFPV